MKTYFTTEDGNLRPLNIIITFLSSLLVLIILFSSIGTIGAGERGVKTRFGAVVSTIQPGLYIKLPIPFERMHILNIQTKTVTYEREDPLFSASSDLQDVKIATVLNYRLDPTNVETIYQQYGTIEEYETRIIRPAVRDTVKATASQYSAEELVTKRAEFTDAVNKTLSERLANKFVTIERVNITNFEFSESFSKAIEEKVTAEQSALAAQNKLEQVKFEAEQRITQATAEAEAIRIQAQAITQQGGKDYVALKTIEKWNGMLPTQMIPNGTVPFVNLNQ